MRTFVWLLTALLTASIGAGALIVFGGFFDVAATSPHWPITSHILETIRVSSIRHHAETIVPPSDLDRQARVIGGTAHFATHCASCHSAPGVVSESMANGMYPKPPALTDAAKHYSPSELFWIVKNGIKMTGMPSWADHGDEKLWNIVAFLEQLPDMDAQTYQILISQAAESSDHHMHEHGMHMPMP
ncbi:c-type cytochrome [Beijerinckia mobilis]|uniref:c-type cytochrome n=1 Tax=Beijerinckia mobilis TaxID=231434 RepID=UPI000558AA71|nr:cytochrome c [Beijerinckia mobilis]